MTISITVENLLMDLLKNGWHWTSCETPGLVALQKEDFKFVLDPMKLSFNDLLRAIEKEAYHRGRKYKDLENPPIY